MKRLSNRAAVLPLVISLAAGLAACGDEGDKSDDSWVSTAVVSPAGNAYQLTIDEQTQPGSQVLEPGYSSFSFDSVNLEVKNLSNGRQSRDLIVETYVFFDCGLLSDGPSNTTPSGKPIITKESWADVAGSIVSDDGYCVQTLTPVTVAGGIEAGKTASVTVGKDDVGFVVDEASTGRIVTMLATPTIVQFGLREAPEAGTAVDGDWFYSSRLSTTNPSMNGGSPAVAAASTTAPPSELPTSTISAEVGPTLPPATSDSISVDTSAAPCPDEASASQRRQSFPAVPPMCIDPTATYIAVIETNVGSLAVKLDSAAALQTVNNFVYLAGYGFYDDTICHRVIKDFVAQCGDPLGTGDGGPGYTIPDEFPTSANYAVGTVAMANTDQPNSGGSQFFIVTGASGSMLPAEYSVLGTVIVGLDTTVPAMNALASTDQTVESPTSEIRILSIKVASAPA